MVRIDSEYSIANLLLAPLVLVRGDFACAEARIIRHAFKAQRFDISGIDLQGRVQVGIDTVPDATPADCQNLLIPNLLRLDQMDERPCIRTSGRRQRTHELDVKIFDNALGNLVLDIEEMLECLVV